MTCSSARLRTPRDLSGAILFVTSMLACSGSQHRSSVETGSAGSASQMARAGAGAGSGGMLADASSSAEASASDASASDAMAIKDASPRSSSPSTSTHTQDAGSNTLGESNPLDQSSDRCGLDHGGCDPATTCTNQASGQVICGPCPSSYVGTGATGCKPGRPLAALVAGAQHACGLLMDGAVKCWGGNAQGQLGLGDAQNRGDQPGQMGDALPALDLGHQSPIALALGAQHSCALFADHSVKCWGGNASGQLGLGDTADRGDAKGQMGDALPAVDLGAGRVAISVGAGDAHTCAVFDDGALKCWGANAHGQLGMGDAQNRGSSALQMGGALLPVDLGKSASVSAVVAGAEHTCALLASGEVKCWGRNTEGQLGLGDTRDRGALASDMGANLASVNLGTGRMVLALAARGNHTCALLDMGDVKCWGDNSDGVLGLGDTVARGSAPNQMGDQLPLLALGDSALAITAGLTHGCALLDGGGVKCWGGNAQGQLGLGDVQNRGDQPNEMGNALPLIDLGEHDGSAEPRSAIAIAAGARLSCALFSNGAAKCWGAGDDGELGTGDSRARGGQAGEMGDALAPVDLGTAAVAP